MNSGIVPGNEVLIADAERCVKCALCLPHCPTYGLKGEEGDSPRGRIELIRALAAGALQPTAETIEHLDGCLACRACEAVCPAKVPYGRMIDGARDRLSARSRSGLTADLVRRLAAHPRWLGRTGSVLRGTARFLPLPGSLSRLRPHLRSLNRLPRLARGPDDGRPVSLFLGCVARALDTRALVDSARILAAGGYRIEIPEGQTCCGALALHAGERRSAERLARRNLAAFRDALTIVASATACTAQLAEYGELIADGEEFGRRVTDVSELLAQVVTGRGMHPAGARPLRVALHVPCTQRNVLRSDAARRCLQAIDRIEIAELPRACCGAAGSYFLERPEDAEALREPLLAAIRRARPDYVLTTNVGCRLHLAAGLGGKEPEVLHLASFLARHLEPGPRGPRIAPWSESTS